MQSTFWMTAEQAEDEEKRLEHLHKIVVAMGKINQVRPFADDDAFNEYAVLELEKGNEVCGVRLDEMASESNK
jgi:hypothetical protein